MNNINISDKEFLQLKDIIYKKSGIHITKDDMKNLKNKLIDRLLINSLDSFRDYYQFLIKNNDEIQSMINAVTTNETYFFREHKHFEFLKDEVLPKIFDAYFTTKHKSQGTGLGLYMSYQIITNKFNGNMSVITSNYVYNDTRYTGAEFKIELPIKVD